MTTIADNMDGSAPTQRSRANDRHATAACRRPRTGHECNRLPLPAEMAGDALRRIHTRRHHEGRSGDGDDDRDRYFR